MHSIEVCPVGQLQKILMSMPQASGATHVTAAENIAFMKLESKDEITFFCIWKYIYIAQLISAKDELIAEKRNSESEKLFNS